MAIADDTGIAYAQCALFTFAVGGAGCAGILFADFTIFAIVGVAAVAIDTGVVEAEFPAPTTGIIGAFDAGVIFADQATQTIGVCQTTSA
jgi:hypothetical protein